MRWKCDCNMTTYAVGDGCHICNTEYYISVLPTPVELADDLEKRFFQQTNHFI